MNKYLNSLTAIRLALLASAASLGIASPALAQDNLANDEKAVDANIIIVTAQKREQDLQDVPISMSVIGGEQLSDLGIQDFNELDRYIPNFYVQSTPGNNAFYIRGIGSTPGNLAFEQTVGLFVDGIYGGHARQFQAPFLDVERIEVLRGPQGALVGKNTSAGAVNVISAKPKDYFEAALDASYEFEQGGTRVFGMASGPVSDKLKARVAVQYENYDGYIENINLGGDEPGRETLYGRATFVLDTESGVDATLKFEGGYVNVDGNAVERVLTPEDPDLQRATSGFPDFVDTDFDDTDSFNTALTVNFEIGDHVLTSVTGYSSYDFQKRLDSDFGPAPLFASEFAEEFSQFSQELRLTSPNSDRFEYIVGAYGHVNDYNLQQSTGISFGPFNGFSFREFQQENKVLSFFGSATYKFTDALRLMASLRYTYDNKTADQTRSITGRVLPSFLSTPLSGERNENEWDPAVTLQWDATPDIMLYATYGQGSKAGGFIGAQATTLPSNFELESEAAETYELGAKLALLDRRLRFDIAAFRTDFSNLQVSSFDAATTSFITSNAGEARSQGVEGSVAFDLMEGLTFNGQLAYLDAKYIDFLGAQCPFTNPGCDPLTNNAAGQPLARSPKWSGTAALDLVQPIGGDLEFLANAGLTFRSKVFLEESFNPAAEQEGYAKIDARIGVRGGEGRWELALVGKNLTDEITAGHAFNTPLAAGIISKYIQPPRTIAVQAKFRY